MPRALEGVNEFMHKDDPIKVLTPSHEARLFQEDQGGEEGLQSIGNHIGDNLVYHITEGYRLELVWTFGSHFLGDKG